jgi:hypothetical protein
MKNCRFRKQNNLTLREVMIATKKTPRKVLFQNWCAILCKYRTQNYDEYKQLEYKLELFLER